MSLVNYLRDNSVAIIATSLLYNLFLLVYQIPFLLVEILIDTNLDPVDLLVDVLQAPGNITSNNPLTFLYSKVFMIPLAYLGITELINRYSSFTVSLQTRITTAIISPIVTLVLSYKFFFSNNVLIPLGIDRGLVLPLVDVGDIVLVLVVLTVSQMISYILTEFTPIGDYV